MSPALYVLEHYWFNSKMSLPKHKRKGLIIVSGIPFDRRESVNFITVSKHKRCVTTMTTEISTPIISSSRVEEPARSLAPLWATEYDTSVYSNTEEATTVPTAQKTERKVLKDMVGEKTKVYWWGQ